MSSECVSVFCLDGRNFDGWPASCLKFAWAEWQRVAMGEPTGEGAGQLWRLAQAFCWKKGSCVLASSAEVLLSSRVVPEDRK